MPDTTVYGVKIHYDEIKPKVKTSKPVLLFLHGWCSNTQSFEAQFKHFSRSHHCIAVDLPGFGKSAKPKIEFTLTIYGEILNQFCKQMALDSPILIGHSMGGLLALEMSWQEPDMPKKIILIDPAPIIQIKEIRQNMRQTLDNLREYGKEKQVQQMMDRFLFRPDSDPALKEKAKQAAIQADTDAAINIWQHMIEYNGKRAFKSAVAPIFYISGTLQQNQRPALERIQPTLTWAQVMMGSHNCHQTEYDQVNAMLDRILADS